MSFFYYYYSYEKKGSVVKTLMRARPPSPLSVVRHRRQPVFIILYIIIINTFGISCRGPVLSRRTLFTAFDKHRPSTVGL